MRKTHLFFAAVAFSTATAIAGEPIQLDKALARIRENVEVFETQLPDFLCREKITSRSVIEKDGRLEAENIAESMFSGRQNRSAPGRLGGLMFIEERHIEKLNGQPTEATAIPHGGLLLGGGYSSTLVMVFSERSKVSYEFSQARPEKGDPKNAVVVAFKSTKSSTQQLQAKDGARAFHSSGRAWFDPVSFEVIRLQQRLVAEGDSGDQALQVTVDYKPVRIGENEFRLPVRVAATRRIIESGAAKRGEYVAEYSNYRKYSSSSTIHYSDEAEK